MVYCTDELEEMNNSRLCSNCGASASGNFCASCGAKLDATEAAANTPTNWQDEVRYDSILQAPEARDLIVRYAAQAEKGFSAEQFLGACDLAFVPLTSVSLSTVAAIVVPLYSRLGIRTGATRNEIIPSPVGSVIVAVLCSLARHHQAVKQVHQGKDGCVLEAVLPSSILSWKGELIISVRRDHDTTRVEAATKIPGQLYDWGKSKRCLNDLFTDLM